MGQCIECERNAHAKGLCTQHYQAKRYKANPEVFRAYGRKQYERHPDKIKERSIDYYHNRRDKNVARELKHQWEALNPEKKKASHAKSRAKHKESIRVQARDYYQRTKERQKAYGQEYAKNNPDVIRAKDARRRARKKNAPGAGYTRADVSKLLKMQRARCAICKTQIPKSYHVDHVVPLATGGDNESSNLQLLCRSCNCSKGAKDPIDHMRSIGFLL